MPNSEQPERRDKEPQPTLARGERRRIERRLPEVGVCVSQCRSSTRHSRKRAVLRGVESGVQSRKSVGT
jgi:hypothetical protein